MCDLSSILPTRFSVAQRLRGTVYEPVHALALIQFFLGAQANAGSSGASDPDIILIRAISPYSLDRDLASRRANGQFVFEQLTTGDWERLRTTGSALVIDLGWESLPPRADIVEGLLRSVREFGIDTQKLLLLQNNQVAREPFEKIWREQSALPAPLVVELPVALLLFVAHQHERRDQQAIDARRSDTHRRNGDSSREKLLVSFNGEARPHRLYLLAALHRMGALDRSHVSLLLGQKKGQPGDNRKFRADMLAIMAKYDGGSALVEAAGAILDRLPMTLDVAGIPDAVHDIAWDTQDNKFYDAARIALVIDTSVGDLDTLHLTEKVAKPIINHMPFLLVSNPGAATLLTDYGFQTFDPLIRQPTSHSGRAIPAEAVRELQRLATLDEPALSALSRELQTRCDWNAEHFWERLPGILRREFMTKFIEPLARRVARA